MEKQDQVRDALLRSAASVAVGGAGFWLPNWMDRYYGPESFDRIGFLYIWSLPIIVIYAVLATVSLVRAYRATVGFGRWGRLAVILGLAMLCWSPVACMGFRMIWGILAV
jgi:hypothetical protein